MTLRAVRPLSPGRRAGSVALLVALSAVCASSYAARGVAAPAPLRRIYSVPLPVVADGVPAYDPQVVVGHGKRDLLFLTTQDGRILALDAHSGAPVWSARHGPGACTINSGGTPCYTTSSPVVDPTGRYVYSYGLDGKVHKHLAGTGQELLGGGWPELATRKGFDEKGSSSLAVATTRSGASYLYVANGGYPGDQGDYQGHLTTIDLRTGAQRVFNATCSNQAVHFASHPALPDCPHVQTAVWSRVPAVYDSATDRLYLATGNGDYDPGSHAWGDSTLALHPDGTGSNGNPLDSYTPVNQQDLQQRDADLGSSAPTILPMPSTSRYRHVAVQAGKDTLLRLLNLDDLSGHRAPGHLGGAIGGTVGVPQGGPVLSQPAVWVDPRTHATWVFVSDADGIGALRVVVSGGVPRLVPVWKRGGGGFSPVVANGLLIYAGPSRLWVLDPRTGNPRAQDSSIGYIHWQSPLVIGSTIYLADSSAHLRAFNLPAS